MRSCTRESHISHDIGVMRLAMFEHEVESRFHIVILSVAASSPHKSVDGTIASMRLRRRLLLTMFNDNVLYKGKAPMPAPSCALPSFVLQVSSRLWHLE